MITLERALGHTAWADDKLFAQVASMDAAALATRHGTDGRSVAGLLVHIVGGAEWYRFLLGGGMYTDLAKPTTGAQVLALGAHLREVNQFLLGAVAQPDAQVTFEDENGPGSALRSTLLSQAAYHSVEHRTQIACTLECAGLPTVDLDAYDFWAYEREVG